MTGWLIVNEYLNTEKFLELQELFMMAASKKGIELVKYTNADFVVRCDNATVLSKAFEHGNPDFVIFYDKDIILAKALEDMGLRVFNSAKAIEICDSKQKTAAAVSRLQVTRSQSGDISFRMRTPATFKIPFTYENIGISKDASFEFLSEIERIITYPMIIKESYSSFGMGVHLAHDRSEAIELISKYGNKECLIQEYIDTENTKTNNQGKDREDRNSADKAVPVPTACDIRLQMVGDKCVAAMMRSNDNDYRANLTNGGVMTRYEPKEAELLVARKAMELLSLDFAGIDIMFDSEGNPIFCEANSNAHFKNLYDLTGINVAEEMLEYIKRSICEPI